MNGIVPVVRVMLLCEEVVTEGQDQRSQSFLRHITYVGSEGILPQVCVYMQLTGCRGPGQVRFRVFHPESWTVIMGKFWQLNPLS
jgi:hypothetical protein